MKNAKLISGMLSFLGIVMISMAFTIEDSQSSLTLKSDTSSQSTEVDIKNMAASSNIIVKKLSDEGKLLFYGLYLYKDKLFRIGKEYDKYCKLKF